MKFLNKIKNFFKKNSEAKKDIPNEQEMQGSFYNKEGLKENENPKL